MKKHTRRILALLSAVALSLSLAACNGEGGQQASSGAGVDGELFTSDTKLEIVVGSHVSWPYNENWAVWQNFRETVGGDITITAIPNETIETKINLMLTSPETLPDLIHSNDGKKKIADVNAGTGAFIAFDDYADQMPNYTAFFNSMDEATRESVFMQRRSNDGKIYYSPVTGTDKLTGLRSWLYRKDVFENHGLKTPMTMEELHDVCVELKKLYPDSYPLAFRYGITGMNIFLPSWRSGFKSGVFYDFKNEKWTVGAMEPEMKDIINYFTMMADEGLIPPNYTTIEHKAWEELVSTNRAFIIPDYNVRIDYFSPAARVENPDFAFAVMTPPRASGPNGQNKIMKAGMDVSGYLIPNTGDEKRIANAVKLLDWFYSDEGSELMNWGIEGETYEEVDGVKKFILPEGAADAQSAFGFGTQGTYVRMDPQAQLFTYSQEVRDQVDFANECTEEFASPTGYIAFTEEEQAIINNYGEALNNFVEEEVSKFYLKQRPMSEYDAFVNTLKTSMHIEEVLGAYESAYNRAMGK